MKDSGRWVWWAFLIFFLMIGLLYVGSLFGDAFDTPPTSPELVAERTAFEKWLAQSPTYKEVNQKAIHMGNGLSPTIEFNDTLRLGEKGYSMYMFCEKCSNRAEHITYYLRLSAGDKVIEFRRGPTRTR